MMKGRFFLKLNKRFFITLYIVISLNLINLLGICSSKIELEAFTVWSYVLANNLGEIIVLLIPIFIIFGCSNNVFDFINYRFISNIHMRKSKFKHLFMEITKSGILGGLIASLPQLINYLLCLILFEPNLINFSMFGLDNGYHFVHYSLLLMFLYGFTIAIYGVFMSLLISRKSLYILISILIYFVLLFYVNYNFKPEYSFVNFYHPLTVPGSFNFTFGYFYLILVIVISIFIGLIAYLLIEKYVEDELYA